MAARHPPAFARAACLLLVSTGSLAQTLPPPPISPAPQVNYEYDAQGNPTKLVLAPRATPGPGLNLSSQQSYDALGRRVSATDAKNGVVQFGYDGLDQLTRVTDPRQLTTLYDVNGLGAQTKLTSPDAGASRYTYDAAGNVKTSTDARGMISSYTYDALNRVKLKSVAPAGGAARQFSWTYDQTGDQFGYGIGRLTTAKSPEVTSTFKYDAQGRLLKTQWNYETAPAFGVGYAYGLAGRVSAVSYQSGMVASYAIENGEVTGVSLASSAAGGATPLITALVASPFGAAKSWQWAMAAGPKPHAREFDLSGRLVRYPLGNLVRDLSYDAAGRITAYKHFDAVSGAAQPAYDQSFGYDELGRLTSVQLSNASWAYAYDANGNRTLQSMPGASRSYTVAANSNRLTSVSNPLRSLAHDAAGNLTSDSGQPGAGYSVSYSPEGRMDSVTSGGSAMTEFAYDAQGQRVMSKFKLVLNSSSTSRTALFGSLSSPNLYAYDQQGHLLGEYRQNGAQLSTLMEYVWLDDMPIAAVRPKAGGGQELFYIHSDHLGAPRVAVDDQGRLRWRWLSEPFGVTAAETSPSGLDAVNIRLRLPGQQYDSAVGLHYNVFRDYDPTTGRYVQSDPIGLDGGINTYAYVDGNPVTGFDPEGLANGGAAQMWMKSPGLDVGAWKQCLADDPLFLSVAPFSPVPLLNIKVSGDLRLPGSSGWTSIDRRFPGLPGANPNGGAIARTAGTAQRIKFAGTYGTAAVAVGTFATSYSLTAMARCACQAGP